MAADFIVRPMRLKELRRAGAYFPAHGYVMKFGRQTVAVGGLAWRWGRCDLWFTARRPDLLNPVFVVRFARRMLRQAAQMGDAEVFAFRDDHPNSAKLLCLVGFQPYAVQDITFDDGAIVTKELWRWGIGDG